MGERKNYQVTVEEHEEAVATGQGNAGAGGREVAGTIALEAAKTEYDNSIKRLDRLDGKINILLTAYAILFAYFSSMLASAALTFRPQTAGELGLLILFLAGGAVLLVPVILLLCLLRGVGLRHLNAEKITERDMVYQEKQQVTKYVCKTYVGCATANNGILQKRYKTYNLCVYFMIAGVVLLLVLTVANRTV